MFTNFCSNHVRCVSIWTNDNLAKWQSGNAAACKAVNAGSIPTLASRILEYKRNLHCDTLFSN